MNSVKAGVYLRNGMACGVLSCLKGPVSRDFGFDVFPQIIPVQFTVAYDDFAFLTFQKYELRYNCSIMLRKKLSRYILYIKKLRLPVNAFAREESTSITNISATKFSNNHIRAWLVCI